MRLLPPAPILVTAFVTASTNYRPASAGVRREVRNLDFTPGGGRATLAS